MRSDYIRAWHALQEKTGMNIVDFFTLKYQEGLSCNEISELCKRKYSFVLTARSINRMLLRHGVRIRPQAESFRNAMKRGRVSHHWKKCSKVFRKTLSPKLRFQVLERDGFKCVYCGAKELLEIDHIVPLVQGGSSLVENLQALCHQCNVGKRYTHGEGRPSCGFVSGATLSPCPPASPPHRS